MSCSYRRELEAWAAARLPDAARRELEAHLPGCPSCREEAARLRALRGLFVHYAPYEPTDREWERIDRAVVAAMGDALERPRASRLERWAPALSLAGAAAAILLLTLAVRPAALPEPAGAEAGPRLGAVVLGAAAGSVLEPDGTTHRLAAPVVDEGDRLVAAEGALTLQTAPATGVRLAPGAEVELETLAPGATALRLRSGELFAEVKPLPAGHSFRVRCADLTLSVLGTAFRVERRPGAVRVEVAHGLVAIARDGQAEVLVPGPGALELADGAPLRAGQVARGVEPATAGAFPLRLEDRSLDEVLLAGARLPEPPPAPPAEAQPAPAPRPAPRRPARLAGPDPRVEQRRAAMLAQVRSHRFELVACFESALKLDPNLAGALTLEVTLARDGSVRAVRTHEAAGRDFLDCARDSIRRWELPGTGEEEIFEIPLRLTQR